jgi:16S rRNA G966 N2-methylase RsmD
MRVITGKARGVRLKAPAGMDIRPTAGLVKEAIFNIIQYDIEGRAFSTFSRGPDSSASRR